MLFRELKYAIVFAFVSASSLFGAYTGPLTEAQKAEKARNEAERHAAVAAAHVQSAKGHMDGLSTKIGELLYPQIHRYREEVTVRLGDIDRARRQAGDEHTQAISKIQGIASTCDAKLTQALAQVKDQIIPALEDAAVKKAERIAEIQKQKKLEAAEEVGRRQAVGKAKAQASDPTLAAARLKEQQEIAKAKALAEAQAKADPKVLAAELTAEQVKNNQKVAHAFELAKKTKEGELAALDTAAGQKAQEAQLKQVVAAKKAEIEAMGKEGVFALQADADIKKNAATNEAAVKMNETKWGSIKDMLGRLGTALTTPKTMFKVALGVAIVGMAYYGIKHGMPVLIAKLVQPKLVSETSKKSWFGSTPPKSDIKLEELTFGGDLQKQLDGIIKDVQSSLQNGENLPNVMLYGPPGTGKTAFAKALAYKASQNTKGKKLDYALTSGSAFVELAAKDLSLATKELRKILMWAKNSSNPVLLFFDEFDSIAMNRELPGVAQYVIDFINTILAEIDSKSQKNLMIVVATNHPYKLDTAIDNRIAKHVEFKLPEAPECAKILETYVNKFSKAVEQKTAVSLDSSVKNKFAEYGKQLVGLAPRAIKFVGEEMTKMARRANNVLTNVIADNVISLQVKEIKRSEQWKDERDKWVKAQLVAARG